MGEDEHQVNMDKDRLAKAETRMQAADQELITLRKELYTLQQEHKHASSENYESRDQLKTLNHNLKNMTEVLNSREREIKTI